VASNNPTSYGATGLPAGLAVDNTTGLISGTVTSAGTSNVTLTASNSGGSGTAPLTLTAIMKPFSNWQAQVFGSHSSNSAIAGPFANPSGDGIPNLLKYAFNANPLLADTTTLPRVTVSGGNLLLTYWENDSATDLTYTVLQSTDLSTWTAANPSLTTLSQSNGMSKIQASVPINGAARRMLRLQVTEQ
jgi:hypothetical protein